ncbi:MAG: hypothetical protein V4623_05830 [Pseudomonadota bacterium]
MTVKEKLNFWATHLAGWHQSGLTQRAYCTRQGLKLKSFVHWRSKERAGKLSATTPVLPALTLVPAQRITHPVTHSTQRASPAIRLHSPGGWLIEWPSEQAPCLAAHLAQLP